MFKISYTDEHGSFRVTEPGEYATREAAIDAVPSWAMNLDIWEV